MLEAIFVTVSSGVSRQSAADATSIQIQYRFYIPAILGILELKFDELTYDILQNILCIISHGYIL